MKALVTGGAGFIGTNLIKLLLREGHTVVSYDNYSTGKVENHQEGCAYKDTDVALNLRNYEDSDVIFHLSALARIQPSFDNPQKTYMSNVTATVNIMEHAKRNNIPVVYAGTSSVHGDKYLNPYTFTKWQAEEVVKMYSNLFNIPACIARFYNVYGPYQATEGAYCNVLGIFEKQYREGRPLTITGDGEQRRDFVHAEDVAMGMIKCMEAMAGAIDMVHNGRSYEFGTGVNYSINEIADAFGSNYPTKYIDATPGEMRETLCMVTGLKELIGWESKNNIIDYIQKELV